MTEVKQIIPTAVNSIGLLGLLAFNIKKFKELETKIDELEEKVNLPQKPVKVDNTEIIEKLNKKIEEMIPVKLESSTTTVTPNKQPTDMNEDEDVNVAISELML